MEERMWNDGAFFSFLLFPSFSFHKNFNLHFEQQGNYFFISSIYYPIAFSFNTTDIYSYSPKLWPGEPSKSFIFFYS